MSDYFFLLIATALVNNVVLVKFLGLCPFMGVSKRIDSALGMSMATTFVIVLAAGARRSAGTSNIGCWRRSASATCASSPSSW